jgi:hypothetical protein
MRFLIPSKTFHASLASGWMSICLFVSAAGSPVAAETPTPDDHVSDEARVLKPETRSALVAKIRQWESETGCTLWLATTTFLPGAKNVREHTDELAEAWMPRGRGLIIAYDRASDAHAVAPTLEAWETYPAPDVVEALRAAGEPFRQENLSPEDRLIQAIEILMQRFSKADAKLRLHSQLLPGLERKAALLFFIILSTGTLLIFALLAWSKKRRAENAVRHFFPLFPAAERLGAPYGGGVIAERR